jgi:hypothetical protein
MASRSRMAWVIPVAATCGSSALAAELGQPRPTAAEIRTIEMQVELPDDANSLGEYIRYYYVDATRAERTIEGGYVSIYSVDSAKWPIGQVAIVHGYDDVPAPYDAGCDVVRIAYSPGKSRPVEARCDPGLDLFPPSLVPGWMYALVPLTPIIALLYFGISRWLTARRTRKSIGNLPEVSQELSEQGDAMPPNTSLERTREG